MGKCNLAAQQPLKLKNCPNPIFIEGIIAGNVLDSGCPTPSNFSEYKNEIDFIWTFLLFLNCRFAPESALLCIDLLLNKWDRGICFPYIQLW